MDVRILEDDMGTAGCPLCGDPIPADEVETVAEDMEYDERSCVACGRCFWEAREAQEGG